jgi:hypothetical protein
VGAATVLTADCFKFVSAPLLFKLTEEMPAIPTKRSCVGSGCWHSRLVATVPLCDAVAERHDSEGGCAGNHGHKGKQQRKCQNAHFA